MRISNRIGRNMDVQGIGIGTGIGIGIDRCRLIKNFDDNDE